MQNSKNCLESLLFKQYENKKLFALKYLERLHVQSDFNKVFKYGLKLENKEMKILAYKRNDGKSLCRLGLVTSRKVGNAVIRNRTKRRLREIFRTNKYFLEPGLDLIFISKPETSLLKYNDLKKIVLGLLKNAKLCTCQD
jgi:ribonuclease P protein component